MGKRYRAPVAPTPLKGRSAGVPAGKATHFVRVMHRECVTRTARDRYLLRKHAYAVVEYRGTRPVRVMGASDDATHAYEIACTVANTFARRGDYARVRELSTCKAVTKARAALSAQELHVADIDRVRECRACGSDNKSTVCKPRRASRIERTEATQSRIAVLAASKRDDTLADPNLITRWTKAQEKSWA